MRITGHKVDPDLLREGLEYSLGELKGFEKEKKNPAQDENGIFWESHVEDSLHVAALSYLFGGSAKESARIAREALPYLPRAVKGGQILEAPRFRRYVGAALWCGSEGSRKWAGGLPRASFANPNVEFSEIQLLTAEAEQALSRQDAAGFKKAVAKLAPALDPKKLIVNPRNETLIFAPLVTVLEALSSKDQAAFDKSWKSQAEAWKKRYGRTANALRPEGLVDFEMMGIACAARKLGLKIPSTSPYVPVELLDAGEAK